MPVLDQPEMQFPMLAPGGFLLVPLRSGVRVRAGIAAPDPSAEPAEVEFPSLAVVGELPVIGQAGHDRLSWRRARGASVRAREGLSCKASGNCPIGEGAR